MRCLVVGDLLSDLLQHSVILYILLRLKFVESQDQLVITCSSLG